eukprot:1709433-Prymnesium_polylepis.1
MHCLLACAATAHCLLPGAPDGLRRAEGSTNGSTVHVWGRQDHLVQPSSLFVLLEQLVEAPDVAPIAEIGVVHIHVKVGFLINLAVPLHFGRGRSRGWSRRRGRWGWRGCGGRGGGPCRRRAGRRRGCGRRATPSKLVEPCAERIDLLLQPQEGRQHRRERCHHLRVARPFAQLGGTRAARAR